MKYQHLVFYRDSKLYTALCVIPYTTLICKCHKITKPILQLVKCDPQNVVSFRYPAMEDK